MEKVKVKLAGREYPLNFSINAAQQLAEMYSDLNNIFTEINAKSSIEQIKDAMQIVHILISEGAALEKLNGNDIGTVPTREEIGTLVGVHNVKDIYQKIQQALSAGSKREVETEGEAVEVREVVTS